jgi:riboflavin synthase
VAGILMFTGLIEAMGVVKENHAFPHGCRLILSVPFQNIVAGESIAVDGVCLTALDSGSEEVAFDVSTETLSKTHLSILKTGGLVNLERAMQVSSRLGGHYVSGHVDTTAQIISFEPIDSYVKLCVGGFSQKQKAFLITKGSITLNGVSLTINDVNDDQIELMLVPHTLQNTNLSKMQVGQVVNIEFDYMMRIIAHQLNCFLNSIEMKALIEKSIKDLS